MPETIKGHHDRIDLPDTVVYLQAGERAGRQRYNEIVRATRRTAGSIRPPIQRLPAPVGGRVIEVKIYRAVAVVGDANTAELQTAFAASGPFLACRPMKTDETGAYVADVAATLVVFPGGGHTVAEFKVGANQIYGLNLPLEPTFTAGAAQRGLTLLWGEGEAWVAAPTAVEVCT